MIGNGTRVDIAVVGDGPAGSALAAALRGSDCSVVLYGADREWSATYGTWVDDVRDAGATESGDIWAASFNSIDARFERHHTLERRYGVVDNAALRAELRRDVEHRREVVEPGVDGVRGQPGLDARIIVDATGWPSSLSDRATPGTDIAHASSPVGWQTAYGVILAQPPAGPLGSPILMDFSAIDAPDVPQVGVPTFAYALPVSDGWLVEETVLVASPLIEPERLRGRLAARLGMSSADMEEAALRVESVRIPMGAPAQGAYGNVVRFGAAAGMINPTTGYSLATSLSSAPRVAAGLLDVLERGVTTERLSEVVWPSSALRTRALHDYGLGVLTTLDDDGIRSFFEAFFALDDDVWPGYMRIDTAPTTMSRTMLAMFRRADWGLRRRLLSGDMRRLLVPMIRPSFPDPRSTGG